MKCPYCNTINQSRVLDTTPDNQGNIRRRRECQVCGSRFSTLERLISNTILIIKSDGRRQEYDREKVLRGIRIACAKRPVSAADIDRLINRVEEQLQQFGRSEIPSRVVGDLVIEGLKSLDLVAYIRYAIVYMGLDSLQSIRSVIDQVIEEAGTITHSQ